jgi:hypothetical protein
MPQYDSIQGYIQDIYEGETSTGKEFLGISFYTEEQHDNDAGYHETKRWFTTPAAIEISQEKVERLFKFAEIEYKSKPPTTVKAALKILAREEFVALPINITVQPNEYEGKVRAQYDLGWTGEAAGLVQSGFTKYQDLLEQRMAAVKAAGKAPVIVRTETAVSSPGDAAVYDDDDIPF